MVSVWVFMIVLDRMCVLGLEFFFSMYMDSLCLVLMVCWCSWIVVVRLVGLVLMIIMLNFMVLCGGRVVVFLFIGVCNFWVVLIWLRLVVVVWELCEVVLCNCWIKLLGYWYVMILFRLLLVVWWVL